MYTNADDLCSKLTELKVRIQDENPDIICITETKLTSSNKDEALGLEHYNIWRKERTHKGGGGIMIMTKKELTATEVELLKTTYAEAIAIEIKTKKGSILVATTYIAPKQILGAQKNTNNSKKSLSTHSRTCCKGRKLNRRK